MPIDIGQAAAWVALAAASALFAMVRAAIAAADTSSFEKMAAARGGGWPKQVMDTVARPRLFAMGADVWSTLLSAVLLVDVALAAYARWHMALSAIEPGPGGIIRCFAPTLFDFAPYVGLAVLGLVFLTLVARQVGTRRPFGVLVVLFWPVWALTLLLWPLCWLLDRLALPGLTPGPETVETSEEEILDLIDQGSESGDIEAGEREMIENIFEMGNLDAEDLMVHRTDMMVVWVEDTEAEILETIRSTGLSRFPVCREDVDDVVGILSTRDYLLNFRLDEPRPLEQLLRPAYFVPESVKADALFREMQRQKIHMAVVVDEYGGTSGLLTMEDLLEQLVGEIYDEFDGEQADEIIPLSDTLWRVRGSAELDRLAEALGVDIPESEEYDTLAGLIFSGLTVIPDDGSHPEVTLYGLRIVVEELLDRRIEWATVEKLSEPTQAE